MTQMDKTKVLNMVHQHWPDHLRSRRQTKLLDMWERGEQYQIDLAGADAAWDRFGGQVFQPQSASDEHVDLESRTPSPWAGLVVTTLAQTAYVEGMRQGKSKDNLDYWKTFTANRWASRQTSIHRTIIGKSTAYGIALPGTNPLTGDKMTKLMARSPKRMSAWYAEDDDEWAYFAVDATKVYTMLEYTNVRQHTGWMVDVYDEQVIHTVTCKGDGRDRKDWTYLEFREHGVPVPPVVRGVNRIDLDGRATGEIEPVLPLLRRIDQDTFDRLIVQRFGAWKVRYIAGMAKPPSQTEADIQAMRLRVEDLLISSNDQTKFGTLDATDLAPFISVGDADLRMLSAVTQTPPHHLLGLSSNLQAEALAAAESGLMRKSFDFKTNADEFHINMARLDGFIRGDKDIAAADDIQVRWRDTESRSLSQAADALGKLAIQLKIPVEMLWEKVPGWNDFDSERAKEIVATGGIEQLLSDLAAQQQEEINASKASTSQPGSSSDSGQ